jgi:hypothetical protein
VQRPLNPKPGVDPVRVAWGRVIGMERGWFARRGSHLRWTDAAKAAPDELL